MFSIAIENRKVLGFLSFFGANLRFSSSRKLHWILRKNVLDQYCSLLTLRNILNYEVCRKCDKLHKKFEKEKVLGFLSLSVSIWDLFHLENRHIHFGKAYWTANTGHFDRFQHSNQRSPTKIRQKLNKIVKNRECFGILVIYWVNFLWQNRIYLFLENYWTTTSCLVERLQHSNLRCLSVNWQKNAWKR